MAAKRENRADGLRELKTDELTQKLVVLTEEKFRLEFRRATESLQNPLQLRTIRRDIARIRTILQERATQQAAGASA
ncbi:MAG TPA: 50S ribosomal protein L29 [Gemmatimonadales bacterium]|nr:50S ribosomal protein L29 [Gemmatimonadales bacterium]